MKKQGSLKIHLIKAKILIKKGYKIEMQKCYN